MAEDITPETTIEAVDDAISTMIDDEEVILNLQTNSYHGLNRVGSEIWSEIQDPTTVRELVAVLDEAYDVSDSRLESDVRSFVADLKEADLVEIPTDARSETPVSE